ncbi:MAG TPA: hypothetical protein VI814_07365 [Candidatus Limnocylindria bacterium]
MKTTQIVIAAVIGLMLLGGGFAAGMTYGKNGAPAAAASASASDRGAGRGQGAGGARFGQGGANGQELLTGQIISVNDGSITVQVRQPGQNGASPTTSSQIILLGSNTRIVKTSENDIKASDLKANDQIQIVGTTDASGNVSATAIVIGGNALQSLFGGQGGFGGRGGASPTPSPTK